MLSPSPFKANSVLVRHDVRNLDPCCPSLTGFQELVGAGLQWHGSDEANEELRQMMAHARTPDWMPSLNVRCSSAASTSTPHSVGSISPPPPLPPPPPPPPSLLDGWVDGPTFPGARSRPCMSQSRKVFVGGIPQSIDKKDLYDMFSTFGKVQRAWLQLAHSDRGCAEKQHRGFGFVMFHERHAIDSLLGDASSRHVRFGDFVRLEVKRAVSKNRVLAATSELKNESAEKVILQFMEEDATSNSLSSSQCLQSRSSPAPAPWHANSWKSHPLEHFDAYPTMPCVSPPPSKIVQPPGHNSSWLPPSSFDVEPPCIAAAQHLEHPLLPEVLHEFVGREPRNRHELEYVLLQGMPDRYED